MVECAQASLRAVGARLVRAEQACGAREWDPLADELHQRRGRCRVVNAQANRAQASALEQFGAQLQGVGAGLWAASAGCAASVQIVPLHQFVAARIDERTLERDTQGQ
ncbi:hypothetical protein RZS08_47485, partial [Arthrospira platensis SPKY1]|nr:hypothetical protein [Arthrospira platensis SPKY1]